jgi:CubicO group peptidase (beta-lactamase class C family)
MGLAKILRDAFGGRTRAAVVRAFVTVLAGACLPSPASAAVVDVVAGGAPAFVAYHDRSSDDHRRQCDALSGLGYRLISLSVSGGEWVGATKLPVRYAAVWVKRGGPRFVTLQDASAAGFQAFFDDWTPRGWKPTILTVTGPAAGPTFAAVFEETSGPIPYTRYGLRRGDAGDPGTIEYWNAKAHRESLIPTTLAIYGSDAAPLFAGVWEPNARRVAWGGDGLNETAAEYQSRFDAQVLAWSRPALVAVSPAGRYLSLFRDDQVGPWVARHDMTSAGYQAEFDYWVARGYYPITVQAGGGPRSRRFAAVFARREASLGRAFRATGTDVSPSIDAAMRGVMVANGVRQAAVAVVKGTRLVFARGYTWAEPGYPVVQPTTYFRVASCSKTITSLAVHQLVDTGALALDDRVQDVLDLRAPDGGLPADPRFADITIRHLLAHTSGIDEDATLPGLEGEREARAAAAFGAPLPATKAQLASLIASKPLSFDPGTKAQYSNYGYLLLGLVVEKLRGTSFVQAVRDHLGAPLGARRIRLGRTLRESQAADEARYHNDALVILPSVRTSARPLVPEQYGGWTLANKDAAGGLSIAAPDFAKILAALNVRSSNPILGPATIETMLAGSYGWDFMVKKSSRTGAYYHGVKGGYIGGLQSNINYTENGVSYVVYWAKNEIRPGDAWYPEPHPVDLLVVGGPLPRVRHPLALKRRTAASRAPMPARAF